MTSGHERIHNIGTSLDKTPAEMREDSCMWTRAGYPAVAIGRYRNAADQIQRLMIELELDRKQRQWSADRIAELEMLLDQANRHKEGRGRYLEQARARIAELEAGKK